METPRYTAIIPVLEYRPDWPALVSLRAAPFPPGSLQILVAEGRQPAAQRNLALEKARGEILLFLDSDSTLLGNYPAVLEASFAQPGVEIVGGPSLLRAEAGTAEKIFHALLTHPLVVGPVSARYAVRGKFRPATQAQLILCNLAVRRKVFHRIGPLSTELYPNEENEWLGRARQVGAGIFYQPSLQVARPQRESLGALLYAMGRYGIGRTRQCVVSGGHVTLFQLLPLVIFLGLLAIYFQYLPLLWVGAAWLVLAIGIAVTLRPDSPLLPGHRLIAGLIAPLVPLSYAFGQVIGWFLAFFRARKSGQAIKLYDESGRSLS